MTKFKQYACSISVKRAYFDFRHDVCIVEAKNKGDALMFALQHAQRLWPGEIESRYSAKIMIVKGPAAESPATQ